MALHVPPDLTLLVFFSFFFVDWLHGCGVLKRGRSWCGSGTADAGVGQKPPAQQLRLLHLQASLLSAPPEDSASSP